MKIPAFYLGLMLVSAVSLQAQAPSPAPAEARFRVLGLDVAGSDLNYLLKDKDVPVSIVSDSRSDFYTAPQANPVVFYRVEKLPDGSLKRLPVAQADLSAGGSLPLLIFSADPAAQDKLRVDVLTDDLKTFPSGTFRILNRDQFELGALFSNQPTVIPAFEERVIEPKPDAGRTTIFFQLYRLEKGSRHLLYSNNWALVPGLRTLVVVTTAIPPQAQPNVRRISESAIQLAESLHPSPKP